MATSDVELKNVSQLELEEGGDDDQGLSPRAGTIFGSSANLIKAIIGSGVLGLPSAFAISGWVLSTLVLLISSLINAAGLHFICNCADKLNDRTANFGGVAEACLKVLAPVADFFMFMMCFGACVSYLIIAGDSIPPFIEGVTGMTEGLLLNRYLWIGGIWLVMGVPLTCVKNINFLSYFSAFAILCIWYIAILVILFWVNPGTDMLDPCLNKTEEDCRGEVVAIKFAGIEFLKSMPTFVFALGCAPQVLPVYNELKNPTIGRANTIITVVTGCVMAIYCAVGLFGYFTYGDKVSSNILNNYPTSILASLARICIGVSVAVSYPLYMHPARQALIHAAQMMYEMTGKPEKADLGSKTMKIWYWSITFVILVTTLLLGIFVGDLGLVFALIGSLASATLGFTLPGLFYFMMFKGEASGAKRAGAMVLAIFGASFSVVGTYTIFI